MARRASEPEENVPAAADEMSAFEQPEAADTPLEATEPMPPPLEPSPPPLEEPPPPPEPASPPFEEPPPYSEDQPPYAETPPQYEDPSAPPVEPWRPAPNGPPTVGEPFRVWYAAYGRALCGDVLSDVVALDDGHVQYFSNIALFVGRDGSVRPLPIGAAAMREAVVQEEESELPPGEPPPFADLTGRLPAHPTRRYDTRPLSQIRHLVIHHTGSGADLTPDQIATEHVEANDWPGIAYHYVIDRRGAVAKTQDLTVETFHVRQFNPAAVGIALTGDFTADVPPPAQIEAVAATLADLLRDLGLPSSSIRGHREMVPTPCPGDAFLTLWKPRLIRLVEARLAAAPA